MDDYDKQRMLIELSSRIADECREQGHLMRYAIQHMLLEAFDKYLVVNEQALRDKLKMNRVDDSYFESTIGAEKYRMSLNLDACAKKEELKKDRELVEKYLLDYMKDGFCYTLDSGGKETEFEDYVKFRKLLEEHGLADYESAKSYFDRIKFENDMHTSEALDEYYSRRW